MKNIGKSTLQVLMENPIEWMGEGFPLQSRDLKFSGLYILERNERMLHELSQSGLVHRGKRDYPYQSYLRLSLRHGFSRNPEGFAVHVYMGYDLRHD